MAKFKVGDEVLITKISNPEVDWCPLGEMDKFDGKVITIKEMSRDGTKVLHCNWTFSEDCLSRNYPNPPHKHAELIKAWADGAEVEYRNPQYNAPWSTNKSNKYSWDLNIEYRIKPQKSAKELKLEELEAQARKLADEIKELKDGS